jgi:hypothetical protein
MSRRAAGNATKLAQGRVIGSKIGCLPRRGVAVGGARRGWQAGKSRCVGQSKCAKPGAIHGVGGGSGGGARRRACGVCGMLSPGSSAHGEAAARWQQCGRRAGGRSGRWGDGVAWCCDSGALCACIVMSVYSSAAGMVVVWRRRWSGGRAGGSLSVTGELMCVTRKWCARTPRRPPSRRPAGSVSCAAGAVAAETTRLAGWLAVTVETGERHPSAHEHSVNSVSAESRSAESRRS